MDHHRMDAENIKEDINVAGEEMNQPELSSDAKREALKSLHEYLKSDIKLKISTDDRFLLRFLYADHFDVEKAFVRIQKYYKTRQEFGSDVNVVCPTYLEPVFKQNVHGFLKERDSDGSRVFYIKLENWDPLKCSAEDLFQSAILCVEKSLEEDVTLKHGLVGIFNINGFSWKHFSSLPPSLIIRVLRGVQNAMPVYFKKVHIVHENFLCRMAYNIGYPFLGDDLKHNVHFYGSDLQLLREHAGATILPPELGGSQPELNNDELIEELLEWEPQFKTYFEFGYVS